MKRPLQFLLVSRTILRRCLLLTSCIIAASFLSLSAFAAEDSEQAQQDLAEVGNAIEEIQAWLLDAHGRQSDEETLLQTAELEIARLSQSATSTQANLDRTESHLALLQEQHSQLQNSKAEQSEVLARHIRSAYMAGDQSSIKLLLNQQDVSKSMRMLHYSRLFSESQLGKIEAFQHTLDELELVNTELTKDAANLSAQQTELEQQMLALNQARTAREQALLNLNSSISSRGSELEQLEINQAELQQLIERINLAMERVQAAAEQIPFANQRGKLPMPVQGPIISRFGSRYGESDLRQQGISIATDEGTLVQAVHAGRVVFSDWLRGSGLLVIIDHGDGYMSLYGANQALSTQTGDWVDSGDILATSGIGSEGTGSIYFEIRLHGEAQNPSSWLDATN